MPMTSNSAKEIARHCNIEITAESNYTSDSVKEIVRIAVENGHTARVHAARYTSDSLKVIAAIGGANVTIVV